MALLQGTFGAGRGKNRGGEGRTDKSSLQVPLGHTAGRGHGLPVSPRIELMGPANRKELPLADRKGSQVRAETLT